MTLAGAAVNSRLMTIGDLLILWTARLTALCYAAGILLLIRASASPTRRRYDTARFVWTAGCLCLCAHVLFALHFRYHWNHARMIRETDRQAAEMSGMSFKGGAYINYAFMLVWMADALWWRLVGHARYRRRPAWVLSMVHGFMAFIAFNAVIVFAKGPIRGAGIAACILIAAAAAMNHRGRKHSPRCLSGEFHP